MKPHKLLLLFSFFSFLFAACEDAVDIQVNKGTSALVVDGWLTNRAENHYVKLYLTNTLSGSDKFEPVSKASLFLTDDAGNSEQLKEISSGRYEIATMKGVEGYTYTLRIQTPDGNYEVISKMPRLSMAPDSLTFKYEEESIVYEEAGYYPYIHGQELEGKDDYIQVKLFKNNRYLNSVNDINLFPDKFVDGSYIATSLETDSAFVQGDTLRAEVWSLTESAYNFWTDIRTQLQNGGIFASPLTNARTNVRKLAADSKNVVGYFGTSLVKTVERRVD